jgi:acetyl esterase/lipase
VKGYVVASINYRLSQDATFPAQIEDCKAAVRWLRAHAKGYKIDRDHVIAWGDSAGGHLASLLGTAGDAAEWEPRPPAESSRVQAVIDWYGRADLTRVCTDPSMAEHAVARLIGGSGQGVYDTARKASPIAHVTKDDPPFLIMHGEVDTTVPVQQSEDFAAALRTAGVPVILVVLKGIGHGGEAFMKPDQVRIIDTFLQEHLDRRRSARSN